MLTVILNFNTNKEKKSYCHLFWADTTYLSKSRCPLGSETSESYSNIEVASQKARCYSLIKPVWLYKVAIVCILFWVINNCVSFLTLILFNSQQYNHASQRREKLYPLPIQQITIRRHHLRASSRRSRSWWGETLDSTQLQSSKTWSYKMDSRIRNRCCLRCSLYMVAVCV